MNGKQTTIKASDGGTFSAYLSLPPSGRGPGVLMISEIFGVNDSVRKSADLFAQHGYVVLAPDLYRHLEPGLDLAYDKASHEKAMALHKELDYERCVADMADALKHLRGLEQQENAVFVTGFCLGGTLSYLAAARLDVDAASAYYATRAHQYLEDGPRVRCPLQLHFGRNDHLTPPEALEAVRRATAGNSNVTTYLYDAAHQFANPDRPEYYIEAAARLAHQRTFELFDKVAAQARPRAPGATAAGR